MDPEDQEVALGSLLIPIMVIVLAIGGWAIPSAMFGL